MTSPKRNLTEAQASDRWQHPPTTGSHTSPARGQMEVGHGFQKYKHSEERFFAELIHPVRKAIPPEHLRAITGNNVDDIDAYQYDVLSHRLRATFAGNEDLLNSFDQLRLNHIAECPDRRRILFSIVAFNFTTRRMLNNFGVFLEYFLTEEGGLRSTRVNTHKALYFAMQGVGVFYGELFWHELLGPFMHKISPRRSVYNTQLSVEYLSEIIYAALAAVRSFLERTHEDQPWQEVRAHAYQIIADHAAVPLSSLTESDWRSRTQNRVATPQLPAAYLSTLVDSRDWNTALQVSASRAASEAISSAPPLATILHPARKASRTVWEPAGRVAPPATTPSAQDSDVLCIRDARHHFQCPISHSNPVTLSPPCNSRSHSRDCRGVRRLHISELAELYLHGYPQSEALAQLTEYLSRDPPAAAFMTQAVRRDSVHFASR